MYITENKVSYLTDMQHIYHYIDKTVKIYYIYIFYYTAA